SQGETFSMSIFRSLKATYYREALDFVQIYKKDALMNKYEIDWRWSGISFPLERIYESAPCLTNAYP
ncbi:MAG: hypothetical protein VX075_13035, partial [Pseudomonadota bacterium]|nr:hypothetical protein [Pseudomonadota bacterium]